MGNACCLTRDKTDLHVELRPISPPGLCLFGKQHMNNSGRPLSFVMKEQALSCTGDDFKIKEAHTENTVYNIEGRGCACGQPKVLSTLEGKGIFVMKHDLCPPCKQTQRVYSTTTKDIEVIPGTETMAIQKQCAYCSGCQGLLQCVTMDSNGREVKLMLFSDCCSFNAVLFWGDPKEGSVPVATVSRKYGAKDFLLDKQNYVVSVAPGMDIAIAIAMALAFDEVYNDKQSPQAGPKLLCTCIATCICSFVSSS
uniref:Phospholipid scramblase n=1 Tax=Chromera velia CCMP2878 TaxID=1169474 RepID=A0A0G4HV44_9ALVE|eukprot:Cvel_8778.t1-p1 / transcript=Cvel_8778.t1 / gene=Cvel_8778 / organism=Chromera_velia_CCMP2878 / gene_product=hypothetical protein / transcript_product=hypothetical protein / location=Cvel_scaffold491:17775-18530(-) / protein_length=252 / sequence_SO=supercontig / SO=protein_coding / is_pseudo=false